MADEVNAGSDDGEAGRSELGLEIGREMYDQNVKYAACFTKIWKVCIFLIHRLPWMCSFSTDKGHHSLPHCLYEVPRP